MSSVRIILSITCMTPSPHQKLPVLENKTKFCETCIEVFHEVFLFQIIVHRNEQKRPKVKFIENRCLLMGEYVQNSFVVRTKAYHLLSSNKTFWNFKKYSTIKRKSIVISLNIIFRFHILYLLPKNNCWICNFFAFKFRSIFK